MEAIMSDAVSEEKARGMLCPLSFATQGTKNCAASCCMAWQWQMSAEHRALNPSEPQRGYCGIANL
jgi:hypothetical protein